MSRKLRKHYTPQEKVAILREHLLEGQPISQVCERYQIQPTAFYGWQKQFFENGAAALERRNRRRVTGLRNY
jgi:transposase-like protein